jgi:hypothetical protein
LEQIETARQRLWRHFKTIAKRENAPDYRMTIEELFIRAAKHHGAVSDERARKDAATYNKACHVKNSDPPQPLYIQNYLTWLEAGPSEKETRPTPREVQPGAKIFRVPFQTSS